MASGLYTQFKKKVMEGAYDLVNDTIMVALYDSGHTFNANETAYTTTHELPTLNGYVRGGAVLTGQAVSIDPATSAGKWTAAYTAWTGTFTAYHAVIYDATADNDLICSIDLGGARTITAGTLTLKWDGGGLLNIDDV